MSKIVSISGGETADQLIRAGLLDEITLHIAPFLFGGGKPLFGTLDAHVELEQISAEASPHATHLRYRVVR
jgi:dihydrofolate reductase